MKRLIFALALLSCTLGSSAFSGARHRANAQLQPLSAYSYSFYGQSIPLFVNEDAIAVAFTDTVGGTRGIGVTPYEQLQSDLDGTPIGGVRGSRPQAPLTDIPVSLNPLGNRYALLNLSTDPSIQEIDIDLIQKLQQRSYVQSTLPVLTLNSDDGGPTTQVILPNEMLISLDPDLSNSQVQTLLNRYDLSIIRSLHFSPNRYLVTSRTTTGLDILPLTQQLNTVTGIQSATPNFIQTLPYTISTLDPTRAAEIPSGTSLLDTLPMPESPFPSTLLPLAWHLDSTPQRGQLLPRTDLRVTDAWRHSDGGEGVVVAVIDSLIQWDHPDLINQLHTISDHPHQLPGEQHGWDFTSPDITCHLDVPDVCLAGDPDTRISAEEIEIIRPHFQNTFQLDNHELLEQYGSFAYQLGSHYPHLSESQIASMIRNQIRHELAAEFHGTWSAGVVAAHPDSDTGAIGVAPNAQIMPIRVFGMGGEITTARLIEAVGYAADRGADVINLSLGGLMPDQEFVAHMFEILDQYPELIVVASAGNDSLDGVAFPSDIPGVLSVGATNRDGKRTFYSSYGGRLDVVAPGGETSLSQGGGILTTGGLWLEDFWQGLTPPNHGWSTSLDPLGQYVQVQGTSFSAPAVSGVLALMKDVNPNVGRDRLIDILQNTASHEGLTLSSADLSRYRLQRQVGLTMLDDRLSGIFPLPNAISAEQYFFGHGLVNAEAAVQAVQK